MSTPGGVRCLFGSWLLATGCWPVLVHKRIAGYQLDDVYLGTADERAASKGDSDLDLEQVDA